MTVTLSYSLPLLRERISKDPEGYREEFVLQLQHFESLMIMLSKSFYEPESSSHFGQHIMFVSRTVAFYPEFVENVCTLLNTALEMAPEETFKRPIGLTLVKAVLHLRQTKAVKLSQIFALFFKLIQLPIQSTRKLLTQFIIKDFSKNKLQNTAEGKEIQKFLTQCLLTEENDAGKQKQALRIIISLYRRNIWTQERTLLNIVSNCCLSKYPSIALVTIHFLLGQFSPLLFDEDIHTDTEKDAKPRDLSKLKKKSRGNCRRQERDKKLDERKIERRRQHKELSQSHSGDAILSYLHDPQNFSEEVLARMQITTNSTYALKLGLLNLAARLMSYFQLVLPNFYPIILRYMNPKQKQITGILATLVQSCHDLLPPETIRPALDFLCKNFVADFQSPEVIVLGIYTIRECCQRVPFAMTSENLEYLVQFRKFKNKLVVSAARSLLNLYRKTLPQLLHRRLRGKQASLALSQNLIEPSGFGQFSSVSRTTESLGIQMLCEKEQRAASRPTETETDGCEDFDEDVSEEDFDDDVSEDIDTDASEDEEGTKCSTSTVEDMQHHDTNQNSVVSECAAKLESPCLKRFLNPMTHIFSNDDFVSLKRALQKQQQLHDKSDCSTNSSSNSEVGSSFSEEEEDKSIVNPEKFKFEKLSKKKREEQSQKFSFSKSIKSKQVRGSVPESVKSRNKPILMIKHKRALQEKRQTSSAAKIRNMRKHISKLKKRTGGKRKYRRG